MYVCLLNLLYYFADYLGVHFASFLLEIVEGNNPELLVDMVIALILAFNQQFSEQSVNVIIEAMQNLPTAKVFTEKLLLLLNREGKFPCLSENRQLIPTLLSDDPTRLLKHHNEHMNTVLRMFIDIFSHSDTAGMFYTNDIKVLIDIVVRQLSDLDAGNAVSRPNSCTEMLTNPALSIASSSSLAASLLFGTLSSYIAKYQLSGASASQARSDEDIYAHLLRGDRMQCIRSAVSARNSQRISPAV